MEGRYAAILLAVIALPLSAASWSPSAGADMMLRSDWQEACCASAEIRVSASILSLAEGAHTISLPLYISYSSRSIPSGRFQRTASIAAGAEAEYSYAFSPAVRISAGAGMRCEWHMKQEALSVSAGITLRLCFRIDDRISISIPLSIYGLNGLSLSAGAGITWAIGQ